MIARVAKAFAFVLIVAAVCLVSVDGTPAASGNHSGAWEVIAGRIVSPCPRGMLCKLVPIVAVEPNYGQALKEARQLAAAGWTIEAIEPAS